MSNFSVEAFAHKTTMGQMRLCIRFSQRPMSVHSVIKSQGGRYRQAKRPEKPCWYIPMSSVEALNTALRAMHSDSGENTKLVRALRPFVTRASEDAVPVRAQSNVERDSEVVDEGGERPKKRLRFTHQRMVRNECRACLYEASMEAQGAGYGQMYHTCDEFE